MQEKENRRISVSCYGFYRFQRNLDGRVIDSIEKTKNPIKMLEWMGNFFQNRVQMDHKKNPKDYHLVNQITTIGKFYKDLNPPRIL